MDILPENARRIKLTRGYFAIVDERDFGWLSENRWHFCSNGSKGYAIRRPIIDGKQVFVSMHREIFLRHNSIVIESGYLIDHINREPLDNRLTNLRLATIHQNSGNVSKTKTNKSGYKGVIRYPINGSWRASIKEHGKECHLGYYSTPEEAALAYNEAAIRIFGDFAYLNEGIERTDFTRLSGANRNKGYSGIRFVKNRNRWRVTIKVGKERKNVGCFKTEAEAIAARDKAMKNLE